jgi:hypothetical protein
MRRVKVCVRGFAPYYLLQGDFPATVYRVTSPAESAEVPKFSSSRFTLGKSVGNLK